MLAASVACALALAACDKAEGTSKPQDPTGKPADADNTKRNERDKDMSTKTPGDQGNNQADIDTTAAIRKEMMKDDSLSTEAKNVKVITEKGVITLRGSVKSQAEKDSIEAKAKAAAGSQRVDNMLEVKAN